METLGQRLRYLRECSGKTQLEISTELNIEQSTWANYENGKRVPKTDILIKIASYFKTTTDFLLGLSNPDYVVSSSISSADILETVAKNILKTILMNNDSSDAAAEKLGIAPDLLQDILNGTAWPSRRILELMSEIYEVSTDYLLGIVPKSRPANIDGSYPFRMNNKCYKRLSRLFEDNEQPYSFYSDFLGLTDDEVFMLKEYGFVPHLSVIIKLSDMFNVSTDYLLGVADELDSRLLRIVSTLDDTYKNTIIGQASSYQREQSGFSVAADSSQRKVSGK